MALASVLRFEKTHWVLDVWCYWVHMWGSGWRALRCLCHCHNSEHGVGMPDWWGIGRNADLLSEVVILSVCLFLFFQVHVLLTMWI